MAHRNRFETVDTADVLVTVEDPYRDALPEVVNRLHSAGLTEEESFELSGIIAGKVALADLPKLEQVEGVAAVELEPTFEAT